MAGTVHRDRGCGDHEADLSALVDGELAAPEAAAVEARLRSCPACAALARDLAGVSRALRAWDGAEPPVAVSAGFRARLLAEVARERAGTPRRKGMPASAGSPATLLAPAGEVAPGTPRLLRWAPAAAAAASMAAVAGAALLLSPDRPAPREGDLPAGGLPSAAVDLRTSAADLLASAAEHRAAGRTGEERRDVLAAWGLSPSDPSVRAAFRASLGFDPGTLERPLEGDAPPPPRSAAASGSGGGGGPGAGSADEGDLRDLWAGPCRFTLAGAFDRYLDYREKARELELALAARAEAHPTGPVTVAADRAPEVSPHPLSRLLGSLSVGPPSGGRGSATWGGIVVYPLLAAEGLPPLPGEPLSLAEALASRRAEVRDSPGRSAGTVLVSNLDPERPLLLLAGEVLEGGRADRMVSRDVLVPPGQRHSPVPVFDVEVGRAANRPFGTRFRGAPGVAGARLRGLAVAGAPEEEVASYVRSRLDLLFVTSSRRSLADAWSDRGPAAPVLRTVVRPQVAELLRVLQDPEVVGFAVAQGPELLSVEVFGSHGLMLAHARRVLEGAALESSTYAGGGRPPLPSAVEEMIGAASRGTSFLGAPGGGGPSLDPARPGTLAGPSPEVGVLALEGGLLGSGVLNGGAVLHASILRGAGSGPLAGRGARTGDLPGAGAPPGGQGTAGGASPSSEGPGSGDPSTAGGAEPAKPADSSPTTGGGPK